MKKKWLGRQICLALALASVMPMAAMAETTHEIDGDTLIVHTDSTVGPGSTFDGKKLSDFKEVEIHFNTDANEVRALGVYSTKYDLPNTNVTVYVDGKGENNDGIHLTNFGPYFKANSYTAYIDSPISGAINISRDTGDAYVTLNYLDATVKQGHGIRANAPIGDMTNTITVNKEAKVKIYQDNRTAVYAGVDDGGLRDSSQGNGKIDLNGDSIIEVYGNKSYGIWAGNDGNINVSNLELIGTGQDSYGVAASNSSLQPVLLIGENKIGSIVTLNGSTNKIHMVEADEDGNIKLDENGNPIKKEGSKAIYADSQYGVVKSGDNGIGTIDIVGDIQATNGGTISLDVNGDEQNYLQGDVLAYGVKGEKNASVTLQTQTAMAYEGDALAANGGTVDVVLGNGSYWAGRADDYKDADDAEWRKTHTDNLEKKITSINSSGIVNMNLGTGSIWDVTGQSWITDLSGNNSYVVLNGEGTGGHALHVGKLEGTNTFVMNVRPDEKGDMLYVKDGSKAGTQNLMINNRDEVLANMNVGDKVRFATVENAGYGFTNGEISGSSAQTFGRSTRISDAGVFNVDFGIEYHAYDTNVTGDVAGEDAKTANDAYNDGSAFGTVKPGSEYVEENYGQGENAQNAYLVRNSVTKENISDAGKTIIDMSRINYSNAIYMDRLNKRMGEARYLDGDEGLWVRIRHDRIGKSDAFRSKNTMMELGYDRKVDDREDGEHRQGFAIDYMRGTADYDNVAGDGDVRRAGVWFYDTWLGDKGHYTDYVLKFGRLSNDFEVYARSTGEKITGDYSNQRRIRPQEIPRRQLVHRTAGSDPVRPRHRRRLHDEPGHARTARRYRQPHRPRRLPPGQGRQRQEHVLHQGRCAP